MAATINSSTAKGPIEVIESLNPGTGEVIGTVPVHSAAQVDDAVRRARDAFEQWGALSYAERAVELNRFRRGLGARADDLADIIQRENGKPLVDAITEVMMALSHLAHATNRVEKALKPKRVSAGVMANFRATVSYHPVGVVGVIGPWNYPMFTPMGSIAYALAVGNTVVFKPSELTPLVGQMIADIAASTITVPNVLQVVTGAGATGGALAGAKVNKIAFTGSTATGKKVMAAAAQNLTPVLMELGGKDPMIVGEDADVDKAVQAAVYGALTNAGQACISVERAYVAAPIYDQFVEKVVQAVSSIRVGGADAHLGAITRPEQVGIIRDHIADAVAKGAKALTGGVDAINGNFVQPTVLVDVTSDMKIMREETFGPVLPIIRVQDTDEAVRLSNETAFGLGSSVFGKAGVRGIADRIRAGMTSINSVMAYAAIPSLPFGGVGESGFGRIHGDEGLREFARAKATAEERFALPMNLMSFSLPANMYDRIKGMIGQLYGGGVVDKAGETLRKLF